METLCVLCEVENKYPYVIHIIFFPCLSPYKMVFEGRLILIGFELDELALRQVILPVFRTYTVTTLASMLHTHAFSSYKKTKKSVDHKNPCLFGHRRALHNKEFHIFRNPRTLRQTLQKLGGRMGYPVLNTLVSRLVVGWCEHDNETPVLYIASNLQTIGYN
jgi:hypothetical protein